MLKAFKYRLYPTVEQEILLGKHFGCTRLIYNLALEAKRSAWQSGISISRFELSSQLTGLKEEYKFLKEVNSQSMQGALKNIDIAYKNFFKYSSGFPKFKSKFNKQSFQCPQNVFIDKGTLSLPKFREGIKVILHRKFKGEIKTVTISRTPTNKYFASILVDNNKELPKKPNIEPDSSIGIDLGISAFAILSDGTKIDNPKYLKKALSRLKYQQKALSRKKKGSNRRNRQRLKVATLHEKITNQRADFLHKLSNEITNRFDTICMEDLAVSNMVKNHCLAQSISDCGWSSLVNMISYKAEWKGKNFNQIGRFEASTKQCCNCGTINDSLTLKDREWLCAECGTLHDRDINAARVILQKGLGRMVHTCQDAEGLRWKPVEASKVQNNMLSLAS